MKTLILSRGKVALISDKDYPRASAFKWYAEKDRNKCDARSRIAGKKTFLHRFLLGLVRGDKRQVDHKDGDGLNCQRGNLRVCTNGQNNRAFKRKKKGASSRFRGVSWWKKWGKWVSQIDVAGRKVRLGGFDSEKDAAKAYDKAAKQRDGKFYHLNFPIKKES